MSGDQFWKLVTDYGPVVAVLILLVLGALLLVALFKPVSRFFLAVNTVLEMPAKFTDLVARLNKQDLVAAEKQSSIGQLADDVKASTQKLDEHIVDARRQTDNFDRDMRPRLEILLRNSELSAAELRHNGGSSVKDDARATREKLDRIEALLLAVKPILPH